MSSSNQRGEGKTYKREKKKKKRKLTIGQSYRKLRRPKGPERKEIDSRGAGPAPKNSIDKKGKAKKLASVEGKDDVCFLRFVKTSVKKTSTESVYRKGRVLSRKSKEKKKTRLPGAGANEVLPGGKKKTGEQGKGGRVKTEKKKKSSRQETGWEKESASIREGGLTLWWVRRKREEKSTGLRVKTGDKLAEKRKKT